jgi:hypothetical protein
VGFRRRIIRRVPPPLGVPFLGVPLAHPLSAPFQLPISPLAAATAGAGLVLLVAFAVPRGPRRSEARSEAHVASWTGSLSLPQRLTRFTALAVLALAIVAGRLGVDDELENLAPALVVGAGWPLLIFASISLGAVWRWVDPWDAVARVLGPSEPEREPRHVWPGVARAG